MTDLEAAAADARRCQAWKSRVTDRLEGARRRNEALHELADEARARLLGQDGYDLSPDARELFRWSPDPEALERAHAADQALWGPGGAVAGYLLSMAGSAGAAAQAGSASAVGDFAGLLGVAHGLEGFWESSRLDPADAPGRGEALWSILGIGASLDWSGLQPEVGAGLGLIGHASSTQALFSALESARDAQAVVDNLDAIILCADERIERNNQRIEELGFAELLCPDDLIKVEGSVSGFSRGNANLARVSFSIPSVSGYTRHEYEQFMSVRPPGVVGVYQLYYSFEREFRAADVVEHPRGIAGLMGAELHHIDPDQIRVTRTTISGLARSLGEARASARRSAGKLRVAIEQDGGSLETLALAREALDQALDRVWDLERRIAEAYRPLRGEDPGWWDR